jgi:FtsZ-binding cell division protein ZapB
MDLESRMATVETDLSAVRKQELPSLRAELERKYHDLRVETHGWAEVAIKAGNKVDRASEVVNLIYTEVRETREEVRAIRGEVAEVRTGLTGVRGEMSALRTEVRGEITGVRGEIAQVRAEQDLQRETLASIEKELGEQGDTLQKILAKLS